MLSGLLHHRVGHEGQLFGAAIDTGYHCSGKVVQKGAQVVRVPGVGGVDARAPLDIRVFDGLDFIGCHLQLLLQ